MLEDEFVSADVLLKGHGSGKRLFNSLILQAIMGNFTITFIRRCSVCGWSCCLLRRRTEVPYKEKHFYRNEKFE